MRKSSVHFKQVANASVSIAHVTRTEETEPAYLLPKEHRLGNVIVLGSMSNIDLGLEFTRAKESMTGQAKARGSSPFWEGVVVLDGTDIKAQTAALQSWKKEYEKATGQRVLHMAIHGDEGFINSAGKPEYNIHAHVIVNRLNDKGRVIKLERKQLSEVQDLTAKSLGMQRGETLEDRKGIRGRKHLNHREFKAQANEKRLDAEHNIGAIQTLKERIGILTPQANKLHGLRKDLAGEPARLAAALKAQEAQLNEGYRLDRERMKEENAEALAAGLAKMHSQKDYQDLKTKHLEDMAATGKVHAEQVEGLKTKLAEAQAKATLVPGLEAAATAQATQHGLDIAKVKGDATTQHSLELAGVKADALQAQAQINTLKPKADRVQGLEEGLTKAQDKVSELEAEINRLTPRAAQVQGLEAQVKAQAADLATLKPKADRVPGLELSLKSTNDKVEKMDEYTKTLNGQLAEADKKIALGLIAKAEAIEAQVQAGIKSESLLVTSNGHRAAAEKLTAKVDGLEKTAAQRLEQIAELGKAVAGANEKWTAADYALTEALNDAATQATEARQLAEKLAVSDGKLGKLEVKHEAFKVKANEKIDTLTGQNATLATELAEANRLVDEFKQARLNQPDLPAPKIVLKAVDTILVDQARQRMAALPLGTNAKATKTAIEHPKTGIEGIPLPTPTKSLTECLKASWDAFKHWIKGEGGEFKEINAQDSINQGPVVKIDDLHAVQRVNRGVYAIHQLDRLDKLPGLDDPNMEIKYLDGKGKVTGKLGISGVSR